MGVQRDEVESRLLGRQRALDDGVAVVDERPDRIAGPDADRAEQVDELVGVADQLAVRARAVRAVEDRRAPRGDPRRSTTRRAGGPTGAPSVGRTGCSPSTRLRSEPVDLDVQHAVDRRGRRVRQPDRAVLATRQQHDRRARAGDVAALVRAADLEVRPRCARRRPSRSGACRRPRRVSHVVSPTKLNRRCWHSQLPQPARRHPSSR